MKKLIAFFLILAFGVCFADTYKDLRGTIKTEGFVLSVAALDATESHPIFCAPFNCTVTKVGIIPRAAVTGNTTNSKNLNIVDAGSAGLGVTEVGNLDLITNVNLTALDYTEIPLNATYTSGVEMDEGDVLNLEFEEVTSGVLIPDLIVLIEWKRR